MPSATSSGELFEVLESRLLNSELAIAFIQENREKLNFFDKYFQFYLLIHV